VPLRLSSDRARKAVLRNIRKLRLIARLRSPKFENDPSVDEMRSALLSLGNLKSPRLSGLPAEFFKRFPDTLILLRRSWLHSRRTGRLPAMERSILITLVPKKGDLQLIQNWRPISLANVGYKIMRRSTLAACCLL
jgi:hypothetical protein